MAEPACVSTPIKSPFHDLSNVSIIEGDQTTIKEHLERITKLVESQQRDIQTLVERKRSQTTKKKSQVPSECAVSCFYFKISILFYLFMV